jgi:tetratricopeptide (TPR) repeat protein
MGRIKLFFNKERLLIILVVALFYGNTLKNGYSLDDSLVTEKGNSTTKGIRAIPKIIKSFYIEQSADFQFDYRPIVKISYAIEHELFGVNPTVSHFFNLVFYLLGLYILYNVLLLLFPEHDKNTALYVVLLFAVLPIHTEVVNSLKNRDMLLCFMFCMLGLKHFVLFINSNFKKWASIVIMFFSFYLAFLSKLDVVPYLAIVPIIAFIKHPKHLKWAICFAVLLFSTFILFRLTKNQFLGHRASERFYYYFENPLYYEKGLIYRFIAGFNSLGFYLTQTVFPLKMCCYYGTDTIPVTKLNYHGYIGILFTPLLIFGLIKSYLKKNHLLLIGIIIFCASISMYLNVVKPAVGIVADRFVFFASLGVAIIFIALLNAYFPLNKPIPNNLKIGGLIVFVFFGILTVKRNTNWNNKLSIIDADFKKYPNNAYLNYKHAMDLVQTTNEQNAILSIDQKRSNILEARSYLEKSIEIEPNYANSRNYLAYVLVYLLNDFTAALPHLNHSIAFKETTELYYYKAICMRETKQKDSSEFYLLKCIGMDSLYYNAYGLLMFDYNAAKNYQKSIDLFNGAIEKGVSKIVAYSALGKTYLEMGDNDKANFYYQKALLIDPSNQEAIAMVKRTSAMIDTTRVFK